MSWPVTRMPGPAFVPSRTVVGRGAPKLSTCALSSISMTRRFTAPHSRFIVEEGAEVEVHVRHRGEERALDELVHHRVGRAETTGVVGVRAMPFTP